MEAGARAGDLLSCRAIPETTPVPGAMGAAGRSLACEDPDGPQCDVELLRRGCDAGFPVSCFHLARRADWRTREHKALMARGTSLAYDGCRARIADECAAILNLPGEYFGVMSSSELGLLDCEQVAELHRRRGDLVGARDLLERQCQYARIASPCIELGEAYRTHALPEPVPGRGEALLTWGCRATGDPRAPACKARARP
ncbi:MAG TPA: hypothetical protein VFK02_14790 [Kofleriaceae bacterium]|nr:hypothetical protein [Kofleriaceae bacterium]